MGNFVPGKAVAVGEAMLKLAPVGDGLYRLRYAGDTFNTIWHMAQLLGESGQAGFVTRIGTDRLSDRFAAEMEADGLMPGGVSRDPSREMGLYLIKLDGVERSFHYWRQHSAARGLAEDAAALRAALAGAGLIHVSGITLAIFSPAARTTLFAALDAARGAGALVSFDPNIRRRPWNSEAAIRETVAAMLSRTDIALPSFDDEAATWGDTTPTDTLVRLASAGVAEVAVKNGAGPVLFEASGERGAAETPAAPAIVDPTGAGDAFNAGYLAARLQGAGPVRAIASGQALAAEVIAHYGARAPRDIVRAMGATWRARD